MELIPENKIPDMLKSLPGWNYENKGIHKEYTVKNFPEAVSSIVKTAFEAEKMDHHPDITIHSYNKVRFSISTHSKGGVTENDIKLAGIIEQLLTQQ